MRNTRTGSRGSIFRPRATCARPAPLPALPALESGDRQLAVALKIKTARASPAVLFGPRPEPRTSPTAARPCANATAREPRPSAGPSAIPSRARCARAAISSAGHGHGRLGRPCRCRSRCASSTANGHAEVACATSDIGTGTYTIMAQVAADMLGLPLDNISIKLGNSVAPAIPRSKADRGSQPRCANAIAATGGVIRGDLLGLAGKMPGLTRSRSFAGE